MTFASVKGRKFLEKSMNSEGARRNFLKAGGALCLGSLWPVRSGFARQPRIRLGLMLPFTGAYSQLGRNITDAFRLHMAEHQGTLGGCDIDFIVVDDESDPSKAYANVNRLVIDNKVDALIGTVHSGVLMEILKVARESGVPTIIPNAGTDIATGQMCAPNLFRTSFSTWQTSFPMGKVMVERGHKKAVFISWKYAFGEETLRGLKEGYVAAGGEIVEEIFLPFPNVEFQSHLRKIATLKPDATFAFFAGSSAVKFVKDYASSGLKGKIPLYGSGFLTDGTLEEQGDAADGILTTLHYGDGLNTPKDKAFRAAFLRSYGRRADVYAVQGYDTAQLLAVGLESVRGDVRARKELIAGMEHALIDSPRGKFSMSEAHNPVQDIYLRKVENGQNKVVAIAAKRLADPARGCAVRST